MKFFGGALLVLALGLTLSSGSFAQVTQPLPRVAVLSAPADCGDQSAFVEELVVQVGELPVEVQLYAAQQSETFRTSHTPSNDHLLAALWLCRKDTFLSIVIDAAGERYQKQVSISSGHEQLNIVRVGLIARSAVETLLRGGEIARETDFKPSASPEKESKEPSLKEQESPTKRRGKGQLELGTGYVGTFYGKNTSWQSGVRLGVNVLHSSYHDREGGLVIGLSYSILPTLNFGAEDVSARLYRHPMRLALGHRWVKDRIGLRAGVALIGDVVVRETVESSSEYISEENSTRFGISIGPELGLEWNFAGPFRFLLSGGLDIFLNRFDHVVGLNDPVLALEPHLLRPRIALDFATALW